jgi:hypothetical protein
LSFPIGLHADPYNITIPGRAGSQTSRSSVISTHPVVSLDPLDVVL